MFELQIVYILRFNFQRNENYFILLIIIFGVMLGNIIIITPDNPRYYSRTDKGKRKKRRRAWRVGLL